MLASTQRAANFSSKSLSSKEKADDGNEMSASSWASNPASNLTPLGSTKSILPMTTMRKQLKNFGSTRTSNNSKVLTNPHPSGANHGRLPLRLRMRSWRRRWRKLECLFSDGLERRRRPRIPSCCSSWPRPAKKRRKATWLSFNLTSISLVQVRLEVVTVRDDSRSHGAHSY